MSTDVGDWGRGEESWGLCWLGVGCGLVVVVGALCWYRCASGVVNLLTVLVASERGTRENFFLAGVWLRSPTVILMYRVSEGGRGG